MTSVPSPALALDDSPVGSLPSRFVIRRRLGEGAFGSVWEVFDAERSQVLALKALHRVDSVVLYRFKQEFRALSDLEHPNLIRFHQLFNVGAEWFFTMDLVEGVDFLSFVRSEASLQAAISGEETADFSADAITGESSGPLELPQAPVRFDEARLRSALLQLAQGVMALHTIGKMHRDLKPSNVLVDAKERLVILDFGLVRDIGDSGVNMSVDRQVLGTPAYMSPEQAAAGKLTSASDWYSVGTMLFEALVGRKPYVGTTFDVMRQKQSFDAPDARELSPGLPEDLVQLCKQLLSRDPLRRPTGADLIACLEKGHQKSAVQGVPSTKKHQVVGRETELVRLRQVLSYSENGNAVIARIRGTSGYGKSALVRSFLDEVSRANRNILVLYGRCYEQESVPFKALDCLIDALTLQLLSMPESEIAAIVPRDVGPLTKVFPILKRLPYFVEPERSARGFANPQEHRTRAFASLRDLFARISERRPIVACVDDLQWGDLDSAKFLNEIFAPPTPPSMLLIESFRSEDIAGEVLSTLLGWRPDPASGVLLEDIEVGPLNREQSERLALTVLEREDDQAKSIASSISEQAFGNPYFVIELAKEWGSTSVSSDENHEHRLAQGLERRIEELDPTTRRLLEIVAAAGHRISLATARKAAGIDDQIREGVAVLRRAHLVIATDLKRSGLIEIYHERVRRAVLDQVSAEDLAQHHHRLAVSLETDERTDAETIAQHFMAAGNIDKSWYYLLTAAERATESLAFDRAARLYQSAIELKPEEQAEALRGKLGDALSYSGRGALAADSYLAASKLAPVELSLDLQKRAAEQLLRTGHFDRGIETVKSVMSQIGLSFPTGKWTALASLLLRRALARVRGLGFKERSLGEIAPRELVRFDVCWAMALGLSMVDPVLGLDFQTRALLLALRTGEPRRISRAIIFEASYVGVRGDGASARTSHLLKVGNALAERSANPADLGVVQLASCIIAYLAGRWRNANEHAKRAEEMLRDCPGFAWELITARHYIAWSAAYLGRYAEMALAVKTRVREALEHGDLYSAASMGAGGNANLAWLIGDDPESSRREADLAMQRWSQQGFHLQHFFHAYATAQVDLYEGKAVEAVERVSNCRSGLRRTFLLSVQHTRMELAHIRARTALALAQKREGVEREDLLGEAEKDASRIRGENAPYSDAFDLLIRASIANLRNQRDSAISLLKEAISACVRSEMAGFENAARRRLGQLLGDSEVIVQADKWFLSENVKNPERMVDVLVPGAFLRG